MQRCAENNTTHNLCVVDSLGFSTFEGMHTLRGGSGLFPPLPLVVVEHDGQELL